MNGIIENMDPKKYHASPELSASGLVRLAQSPAHYRFAKDNQMDQTPDMRMGSAIHGLKHGDQKILRCDVSTRNTKAYKEMADANPDAIILLGDEYENALRVIDALEKHPLARELYSKGRAEVSAFWTDPEAGVPCKARADFLRDDGIIIDLKTTVDASRGTFERNIMVRKYHWQSAFYLDGFGQIMGKQLENFVHIVVEKEAPFGIGVYVLDNGSLDKAREDLKVLKERFAHCLHTGEWPGYETQIQNIGLPAWAFSVEVA
jgi:hypothetical protein